MNSYWVAHAVSENHCKTTKLLKICYLLNISQEKIYCTKISEVNKLKRCINSEWVALSHALLNVLGIKVYVLAFMLTVDILSTRCNKDDVM